VVDVLIDRLDRAARRAPYRGAVLSGGVAANSALRAAFLAWSERTGIPAHIPHLRFCTDNAAMIAAAADRQGEAVRANPMTLSADPSLPFAFA
jgi:N6-L-threonylcarbamoyladenine synthase